MANDPWAEFKDGPPASQAIENLRKRGAVATNGFRTDGDVRRLRNEGYTPATDGPHNRGDGVDLTPGGEFKTLRQLQAEAQREFGPAAKVEIHNGTHVHAAVPGWGYAPDVTRGDPWDAYPDASPSAAAKVKQQLGRASFNTGQKQGGADGDNTPSEHAASFTLTGQAHDGDTIRLTNGRNGRVFGFDAFELSQQGRRRDGSLLPLGVEARDFMLSHVSPGMRVTPTGDMTYGRPVVAFNGGTDDPARNSLRLGLGLAEPRYLRGTPVFNAYVEAERLARLNLLGGHGTNAETPSQFRHKNGPWKGAEPGIYGQGADAILFDDPTPFQGLRPEIAKGYLSIWNDMKSKPEDLLAYASANGFTLDPEQARKAYERRNDPKNYRISDRLEYLKPPRPLIDPGDKQFGTTVRGFADPFNVLDELGGVADTLGATQGRENVFNSERRFGDILANNTDQNRAILDHDQATHPYYRLGGQLASGLALPLGAAKTIPGMMAIGAVEGGIAGGGAGEGGFAERFPNAALGAVLGTVGGAALGTAARGAGAAYRGARRFLGHNDGEVAGIAPEAGADAAQGAEPPAGAGPETFAAMRDENPPQSVVGPVVRQPDVINVHDLPPLPEGFTLDAPFGVTRNTNERLSPEEMAKLAEGVDPASVLPHPANEVGDLSEAVTANPGRFAQLDAPDAVDHLTVRTVTTKAGGKVRIRGPLDITQSIRLMGGLKDEGGTLAHLGLTNAPRRMPFGSNEQFLGKLVDNEGGVSADDAALRLWEEGYFPEFQERPTPDDLIDRLHEESTGAHRYFHPDDLAEVGDFHSAQAERGRIDAADSAGAPLVDERGSTINLDDLVANTPPTSAYGDTPRLTGKIGNINLDRLGKPGDVAQLIDQVASRVGGFDAAARGRVTNEETQRLAQEIGVKPEQLLQRRQGQALNAEQLYASRALVQRSRETVVRLAQKAVSGSDDDLATFRKAWLRHVALEEHIAGATAEAGRALQQFKMLADAGDASGDAVRSYLRGGGGRDSIEDAARAIVDLSEDPAKANHFMREAVKPRWRDKFNELWINSLLSGPRTHIVNMVGNALTTVGSFPELAMTAAIGKVTRSVDRAYFGEVGARAVGLADSSVEALHAMRTAFRTGEPLDAATKVEATQHQAIGGALGKIIRTPTRALTAADEFWKTLLTNAELRQIAYRKAMGEAGGGAGFKAHFDRLLHEPTDAMLKQAREAARYYTFQKELGPVGRSIQQISNNWIGGKLLLPFVRTPINLLKFAGERSVLGVAMPEVRAALRAGGRARDEALARITLGSGLSTAAVVATMDGRMSGSGPTDPRERAALLQAGWQPNSIRIGDQWVSYARFDPISTLFGVAADFADAGKWATKKEADAIALNLATGIAKNVTNKTWLSGLSDAFDVLSDPERYGKGYVQKLAGSLAVPAAASQTAQALDPNLRDARTIMDTIKARVPVISETVPARLNVWGEPISKGDAIGPDIISPFYATQTSKDPVNLEVARLRVPLSAPKRFMKIAGKRVDLTPEQYAELVQMSGRPAKQYLRGVMESSDWKQMSDGDRAAFVKDALKEFREIGRASLKERHPELAGADANEDGVSFRGMELLDTLKKAPRKGDQAVLKTLKGAPRKAVPQPAVAGDPWPGVQMR